MQPSILLMFEPAKKPVKGSSPEEACLSSLGLNGCCEVLTARLSGASFEKMGDFVSLLSSKDILRWWLSEAVL